MSQSCILVTGASSGIGQKIAIQLSKYETLILGGKNAAKLAATRELCENPAKHHIWECDLENVSSIRQSLEVLIQHNNLSVHGFIHCAGMMKVMHMRSVDYQNALQIFNVNFFSATEIISSLLKKKINDAKLANIIFISAILAQYGAKGHNLYSATKAALDGLMRSIAVELAPNTRVNSVLPGGIRTPMSEHAYNDPVILENTLKEYPLGIGETADVANLVEFLISDKAKWITGQQFIVDGGRTINISNK